jgi:hypothetical protein
LANGWSSYRFSDFWWQLGDFVKKHLVTLAATFGTT